MEGISRQHSIQAAMAWTSTAASGQVYSKIGEQQPKQKDFKNLEVLVEKKHIDMLEPKEVCAQAVSGSTSLCPIIQALSGHCSRDTSRPRYRSSWQWVFSIVQVMMILQICEPLELCSYRGFQTDFSVSLERSVLYIFHIFIIYNILNIYYRNYIPHRQTLRGKRIEP